MAQITTVNLISGGGSTNLKVLEEQKPGGRLYGLAKTTAIICNNSAAAGIQRAIDAGFSEKNIHLVSRAKGDLGEQILDILEKYKPNYYHQLGWLPWMPDSVINRFWGLNQHLGPGGKYMIGERRIFAHLLFCQTIGELRPIPVFCQYVHPVYDSGHVIYVEFIQFDFGESVGQIARRLLPIEHEVQVEALRLLGTGTAEPRPVPRVYETSKEEMLMDQARLEAEEFYKFLEIKGIEAEVFLPAETHNTPRSR